MSLKKILMFIIINLFFTTLGAALAQEALIDSAQIVEEHSLTEKSGVEEVMFTINNVWMMVAIFLVFIMHLGFASLEAGLTRAKNTVNILFKNTAIISIGLLSYTLMGFNLMYPGEFLSGLKLLGFSGFGIGTDAAGITSSYNVGYTYWTDFLFQGMFAATAATIVSGAVAERIKLSSFMVFSTLYISIVYPIIGSWGWGAGWLSDLNFHDFAGSTYVHSVGGWAALAGVLALGPRHGKYINGTIRPIMGHNMPLATIGVFLLWLGWFGFNGGSVLSADPGGVSFVLVTTCLAAAAGIIGAMFTSWTVQKKPDLSMVLNGSLAGLVGITAGADLVSITSAIIIGLVAGIIVVLAVELIDRLHLDDPVGAISVHLICGVWGTLAVGIFSSEFTFLTQLTGVLAAGAFSFIAAYVLFYLLKITIGIRVSLEEEMSGLDIGEHGMEAYAGFQIFTTQ
ncbi:MAG: ammonium transporter [Calditrichaeota bacterium]|nr:MAG: ammonium transporter [Calditrichota bacterium]MBL1205636.1 ammonium transporter [Calditrichota bacterium]NOG45464.1 ammonium transporter [Calditrichota bacterium]